jgi:hypothetical protein
MWFQNGRTVVHNLYLHFENGVLFLGVLWSRKRQARRSAGKRRDEPVYPTFRTSHHEYLANFQGRLS